MITQCPNCETTFRVTGAILRAAHGQVRCGRCQTQFDAVARLIDEDGTPTERENEAGLEEETQAEDTEREDLAVEDIDDILVEEPEEKEDITLEGQHIEITGTYRIPSYVEHGSSSEEGTQLIEEHSIIEAAEVDLADDDDGNAVPVDSLESPSLENPSEYELKEELLEDDGILDATSITPLPMSQTGSQARRERLDELRERAASNAPVNELDMLAARAPRSSGERAWMWAAVPLVLLLAVQVFHHYRNELAVHPTFGSAVSRLYAALHLPLAPRWQLAAYEVRQWGIIMDPSVPGTLKVRASVKNTATFPQPYPLLKLVLENRWGEEVRVRAFDPREYLDSSTANAAQSGRLAPNQLANAVLSIADPGADAEGFRFDVCLPRGKDLVCADNRG